MGKKWKIVILDDEQHAVEALELLLRDHKEVEIIGTFTRSQEAINFILNHPAEILLLDIQMPVIDGFEVVEILRKHDLKPFVIFTTVFEEYAIKAIRYAAFDYLLKPVSLDDFNEALNRLKISQTSQNGSKIELLLSKLNQNKKLRFYTRTGFIVINSNDIIYCEADRNYTIIHMPHDHCEVVSMNLKSLNDILGTDNFFRAGRSLIINTDYLILVDRKKKICTLKYNEEICTISLPSEAMKHFKDVPI